jgi:hypothetical protein
MRKTLWGCLVIVLSVVVAYGTGFAVTTTDLNTLTPQQLVDQLLGGGVSTSNVAFAGAQIAAGSFTGGVADGLGIESGVILTSGNIALAQGPNTVDDEGSNNGLAGDADLTAIVGATTNDATILEFDFVPTASTLSFSYVFASEEYNEFVDSTFNDVFAFLLDGVNIALIPSTATPVAINNINNGANAAFYNDNDPSDLGTPTPFGTQYDGFTTVLTAQATVNPGQTYHIKLAIADTSDSILDSAVFIQGGSFVSGTSVNVTATDPNASETGPDQGMFTITRSGDTTAPLTVNYTVSGTATNGTDYTALSGSAVILAGQSSVTVALIPVDDATVEGNETAILTIAAGTGYTVGANSSATVIIADNDGAAPAAVDVPTMNEWGMIVFMLFAGIASLYYLRRQNRLN